MTPEQKAEAEKLANQLKEILDRVDPDLKILFDTTHKVMYSLNKQMDELKEQIAVHELKLEILKAAAFNKPKSSLILPGQ